MATFVVYEIWTRARVVEADSEQEALIESEPEPIDIEGMSLAEWYAVPVDPMKKRVDQYLERLVTGKAGA